MNTSMNIIHREAFAFVPLLFGTWKMCHSFYLESSEEQMVNVIERYTFSDSGRGEYAYTDDSNFKTESSSRFSFKVEEGRIFFKIKGSFDFENSLEYKIEEDRLILNYGGSEETYFRQHE